MESGAPATSRVVLRDDRVALVAPLYPDDRGRFLILDREAGMLVVQVELPS